MDSLVDNSLEENSCSETEIETEEEEEEAAEELPDLSTILDSLLDHPDAHSTRVTNPPSTTLLTHMDSTWLSPSQWIEDMKLEFASLNRRGYDFDSVDFEELSSGQKLQAFHSLKCFQCLKFPSDATWCHNCQQLYCRVCLLEATLRHEQCGHAAQHVARELTPEEHLKRFARVRLRCEYGCRGADGNALLFADYKTGDEHNRGRDCPLRKCAECQMLKSDSSATCCLGHFQRFSAFIDLKVQLYFEQMFVQYNEMALFSANQRIAELNEELTQLKNKVVFKRENLCLKLVANPVDDNPHVTEKFVQVLHPKLGLKRINGIQDNMTWDQLRHHVVQQFNNEFQIYDTYDQFDLISLRLKVESGEQTIGGYYKPLMVFNLVPKDVFERQTVYELDLNDMKKMHRPSDLAKREGIAGRKRRKGVLPLKRYIHRLIDQRIGEWDRNKRLKEESNVL